MATAAPTSYRIGEVAAKVGLTERTIRYYEERGLLESVKRLDGGQRV
ncbi:MAG TPA: MerR family DNA-binding transcriptional regulator, partial [Candidatus Limnocylindria bacterium]|nr:MerR family DNA-binding transcriptional regulator [Candidatus Limnocylindria bacterium]